MTGRTTWHKRFFGTMDRKVNVAANCGLRFA
jgi:hypothetical protein